MPTADTSAAIQLLAAAAIPVLFGIALHEVSHGWVARAFGDRTAELLGRLSLNPLRHIDPFGTLLVPLVLVLFGLPPIGWARPVPVNARNLRDPRRHMMLVAAAGPCSNLAMALGWALILLFALHWSSPVPVARQFLVAMGQIGIQFNVLLAVFNMLPIPPLDGGRVLRGLVPERAGLRLDAVEPYGLIIVLLLFSFGILARVLMPLMDVVARPFLRLAGIGG